MEIPKMEFILRSDERLVKKPNQKKTNQKHALH